MRHPRCRIPGRMKNLRTEQLVEVRLILNGIIQVEFLETMKHLLLFELISFQCQGWLVGKLTKAASRAF